MSARAAAALIILVALAASPRTARAQTLTLHHDAAFSVDRLTPPPGPGVFVQVEDGDVAEGGALAFVGSFSVETRPLVVRDARTGEELTVPVRTRSGLDLGVVLGLGLGTQVGLSLPVVLYQSGDRLAGLGRPDGEQALAPTVLGDLRVSGKLSLVEPEGGLGQAWGVALILTLPTGDEQQFAGEAGTVVEFHLIGSWRAPAWALAVNLGPRFRSEEVPFLSPETTLGNEIVYGAAASAHAPWWPSLEGVLECAGARGDEGESPAEARLGVRYRVDRAWTAGVVVGAGVSGPDDIGAPAWRGVVDVRWERPRLEQPAPSGE